MKKIQVEKLQQESNQKKKYHIQHILRKINSKEEINI